MTTMDGVRIIDATKDYMLPITPTDIINGEPRSVSRCAGALACLRDYTGAVDARFYKSRVYILCRLSPTDELVWLRYATTRHMKCLEIINDVAVKDIEQAQKYATVIILKVLSPSNRTGRQQGSDKTKEQIEKDKITRAIPHSIPMRENAPTSST